MSGLHDLRRWLQFDEFVTQDRNFTSSNIAVRFYLLKRRRQAVDGRLLITKPRFQFSGSANGGTLAASRTQEAYASYELRKKNAGRIDFSRRHP
jgi:hypothetical protein